MNRSARRAAAARLAPHESAITLAHARTYLALLKYLLSLGMPDVMVGSILNRLVSADERVIPTGLCQAFLRRSKEAGLADAVARAAVGFSNHESDPAKVFFADEAALSAPKLVLIEGGRERSI